MRVKILKLAIIISFLLPVFVSNAQEEYYCLFEKTSDYFHSFPAIISRNDWLSVSKCGEAAFLGFFNLSLAPENQPNMSYSEATILHDIVKISTRFTNRCWRGYSTWIRYDNRQMTWNYQYPGSPYQIEMSNLCCEEAVIRATQNTTPDQQCTVISFLSTNDRAIVTSTGIFSLGNAITLRFRNWPPVVIPPLNVNTQNLPNGTNWFVKEIYPQETRSGNWIWDNQKQAFSANMTNMTQTLIKLGNFTQENVSASFEFPYYSNNVYYGTYIVQYQGKITNKSILGTVTWYWNGSAYVTGTWEVNFNASSTSMPCEECAKLNCPECNEVIGLLCEIMDGHPKSEACRDCIKRNCSQ